MVRILQVYNQQRSVHGGEEAVVNATLALLRRRGHDARLALKSSRGIEASVWRKAIAATTGFYNPFAGAEIARLVRDFRPAVLHAHNIFPDWSPAIFGAAKRAGVATVMSVHSQILTCPTWYHLRDGKICEECVGGREHRCIVNRCRESIAESVVYAGRAFLVRASGILLRDVDAFVAVSAFMRDRLVIAGIPANRIVVAPNAIAWPDPPATPARNHYVAYAGRLSPEKGLDTLQAVARRLPDIPFKCAGDGHMSAALRQKAPSNLDCVGYLDAAALAAFLRNARAVLVPSIAYETFSLATLEAMSHGVPVVASAIGAIPELVGEEAGLLFAAGDAEAAAERIVRLWNDDALCAALGRAARRRAAAYSEDAQYERLIIAYRTAARRARDGIIKEEPSHAI